MWANFLHKVAFEISKPKFKHAKKLFSAGNMLKYPFILLIRVYQLTLSPLLGANKCRYQPTCSQYTIEAIQEWGLFKGGWMGLKRIGRCHPWSNHPMYDPVPKRENKD